MDSVYEDAQKTNTDDIILQLCKEKIIEFEKKYNESIKEKTLLKYNLPEIININYTENTFLLPKEIYKLVNKTKDKSFDLSVPLDIIRKMSTKKLLTDEYKENFLQLLKLNPTELMVEFANINTLKTYTKRFYSENIKHLKGDLTNEVKDIKKEFENILALLD